MNNQLIEKVIKSSSEPCPNLVFSNPLLDHNVARAISKSFVKILSVSRQNYSINNNFQTTALETIRRMCQVEPENHLKVDDNLTDLLSNIYQNHIENTNCAASESTDVLLDAFLLKRIKEIDMVPVYKSSTNPEVVQALCNLSDNKDFLTKDVIHWDTQNRKSIAVLKNLWENSVQGATIDNVSVKLKSEIERILLDFALSILTDRETDLKCALISNNSMSNLINTSLKSPQCYQTCINVLNLLFIQTNFDQQIQKLIETFVENVKDSCSNGIAYLYPIQLSNLVILLDTDIDNLPDTIRFQYIENVLKHMHKTQKNSENYFVLLLSHFPQWFDIYFKD